MRKHKGWTDERINEQIKNVHGSQLNTVRRVRFHVEAYGDSMELPQVIKLCQAAIFLGWEIAELVSELSSRDCTRSNRRNAQSV